MAKLLKPRSRVVLFRVTQDQFVAIQEAVDGEIIRSVSDFARDAVLDRLKGLGDARSLSTEDLIAELARRYPKRPPQTVDAD